MHMYISRLLPVSKCHKILQLQLFCAPIKLDFNVAQEKDGARQNVPQTMLVLEANYTEDFSSPAQLSPAPVSRQPCIHCRSPTFLTNHFLSPRNQNLGFRDAGQLGLFTQTQELHLPLGYSQIPLAKGNKQPQRERSEVVGRTGG